ncbi:hypothetical protein FSP39_019333 [Pinctada imbricata]|uniref:C1q domain-containing protein n=1 Tax=Pinctada imbricata TaxID=66713 RepID=A0AA88Y631_PINIB|nr:hypothetical protein FSP39_019333 [Pinctada imbricata]
MRLILLIGILGFSICEDEDFDCRKGYKYLMDKVRSLEDQVKNLKKRELSPGSPPEQIAFSARLSTTIGDLGKSQSIVFDQVITNVGGRYNNKTGVFYCDMSGTYVFNIHILALPHKWVQVELVKNGQNYAHVYAFDDNHYATGSNSVILDLVTGDSVWVRTYDLSHDTSGFIIDYLFTTFSGFLLYPK